MCMFSWGGGLCAYEISSVGTILLTEEIDFLVEGIQFWVSHVAIDILIYQVPKMTTSGRLLSKVHQAEQL